MKRGPRFSVWEEPRKNDEPISQSYDSNRWLTTEMAALYIKTLKRCDGTPSSAAIRNRIYRNQIRGKKIGRTWLIDRYELDSLLSSSN